MAIFTLALSILQCAKIFVCYIVFAFSLVCLKKKWVECISVNSTLSICTERHKCCAENLGITAIATDDSRKILPILFSIIGCIKRRREKRTAPLRIKPTSKYHCFCALTSTVISLPPLSNVAVGKIECITGSLRYSNLRSRMRTLRSIWIRIDSTAIGFSERLVTHTIAACTSFCNQPNYQVTHFLFVFSYAKLHNVIRL